MSKSALTLHNVKELSMNQVRPISLQLYDAAMLRVGDTQRSTAAEERTHKAQIQTSMQRKQAELAKRALAVKAKQALKQTTKRPA